MQQRLAYAVTIIRSHHCRSILRLSADMSNLKVGNTWKTKFKTGSYQDLHSPSLILQQLHILHAFTSTFIPGLDKHSHTLVPGHHQYTDLTHVHLDSAEATAQYCAAKGNPTSTKPETPKARKTFSPCLNGYTHTQLTAQLFTCVF